MRVYLKHTNRMKKIKNGFSFLFRTCRRSYVRASLLDKKKFKISTENSEFPFVLRVINSLDIVFST